MTSQQLGTEAFDALIAPRSMAVLGVSSSGRGIGASTLSTIRRFGYEGQLAVIHPRLDHFDGVPAFPSLEEVPYPIDMVILCTNAASTLGAVEQSIAVGAKTGILFASGFSESGNRGLELQRQLRDLVRSSGFRVLGPNCQGIVSYTSKLAATFSNAIRGAETLTPTPFAYIGQSGAIGGSLFDLGRERGCVPTLWVSSGNQIDLDVVAVSREVLKRDDVQLIALYLEQLPRGDAWELLGSEAQAAGKRLVVLRSGTTLSGRRAVASHTGAMVGPSRAFEATCERYGILTSTDLNDTLDLIVAHRAGLAEAGRRVAVVSTSGGAGGLAADGAARAGLTMATLQPDTCAQLRSLLPEFASVQNPIDVTAGLVSDSPDRLGEVCRIVSADPNVDQVLVVISMVIGRLADAMARSIAESASHLDTPFSVVYLASRERTESSRSILQSAGVMLFDWVDSAMTASGRISRARGVEAIEESDEESGSSSLDELDVLTESAGGDLLDKIGIHRPTGRVVNSSAEAVAAAAELGSSSFVLKIQTKDIIHKTEVGGVEINVPATEIVPAYERLLSAVMRNAPPASILGVLIQEFAKPGIELLLSIRAQDDGYAPLVTVGFGGQTAELFSDVASRCLPIDREEAESMLRQLRCWPLLAGFRGGPPSDIEAAIDAVVALGRLYEMLGEELIEVEINPLLVHAAGEGATAVDLVAMLKSKQSGS